MKEKILSVLSYIWQLPQNVLGLVVILVLKARKVTVAGGVCYWVHSSGSFCGVCLGRYIILYEKFFPSVLSHEIGHSIQSKYLGPLYLLVIGIPSAVFTNLWSKWFHKDWDDMRRVSWYYNRPWEAWADRLGGVRRTYDHT